MKIINPSIDIRTPLDEQLYEQIEFAGRKCYQSDNLVKEGSAEKFVARMIKSGHEAMLEHASVTILVTCDRGVTHEIVRHRVASYAQESTRYCNYSQEKFGSEITYIDIANGLALDKHYSAEQAAAIIDEWGAACEETEVHYFNLLELGATPQMARSVLNNSTKTSIAMTMNMREWRHFLQLRCDPAAHPQMREVAFKILSAFRVCVPTFVSDITYALPEEV